MCIGFPFPSWAWNDHLLGAGAWLVYSQRGVAISLSLVSYVLKCHAYGLAHAVNWQVLALVNAGTCSGGVAQHGHEPTLKGG
jgi:hypothetical protein